MSDLPTDWGTLCLLVFLLGMRHGVDADHLAAINGFARLALRREPGIAQDRRRGPVLDQTSSHARYCGALFCLGHGAVVVGIATVVGLLSARWAPPAWMQAFGSWISVGFLLALGIANLRAVLRTAERELVALVGLKSRLLLRLAPGGRPLGIVLVGALFALSFDTLSQAALFAVAATPFGGATAALLLALLFVLGMLVTDGLNGWWTARLIARADGLAALASRVMGLAVAGASLLVAALGAARLLSPAFDGWSDGKGLVFGGIVVLVIAFSYLTARALAPRAEARTGTATAAASTPARAPSVASRQADPA